MPTIMTQIMGTAVAAPPELARGAEVAIATAWVTPRTAEAAPAMCGASAAASALALPKMNAWTAIRTRNPAQVSSSWVSRANTPTVRAATARVARVSPNPDQTARPEVAADNLCVDDGQQDLRQGGGGEEQCERHGLQTLLLLQHVGGVRDVGHHREPRQRCGQSM